MLFKVLQINRTNSIYRDTDMWGGGGVCVCVTERDLLEELVHKVMEAERSHSLLSANWKFRKVV